MTKTSKTSCVHHDFKNLIIVTHPLIQHKVSELRNVNTDTKTFNEYVKEITMMLTYEATWKLPLEEQEISTPLQTKRFPVLGGKKPVLLSILRAGLGMVPGALTLMPSARVGHMGIYRNEKTFQPVVYYFKIPQNSEDRQFFVLDPMLATGGSMSVAISKLKSCGVKSIIAMCIIAAPEGVKKLEIDHPDVKIYTACLDEKLNDIAYILPGLGDAGDRMFGTK